MPNQLIDVAVIPIIPQSNKLATVDPEPRACWNTLLRIYFFLKRKKKKKNKPPSS